MSWARQGQNLRATTLIVFGALFADISEHHSSGLLGSQGEIFEELFETVVYWSLISFICNVIQLDKQKKFLSQLQL